jgi:molecular chaperone GrpE
MANEKKSDNSGNEHLNLTLEDLRRLSDETQPGAEQATAGTSAKDPSVADPALSVQSQNSDSADIDGLKAELEKARKDFLYLYAEFENYKKNSIKERSDLRKYGAERLVVDLLNVVDIFETALSLENSIENAAAFRKGIEMTAHELKQTLARNGVEEQPALGAAFNPLMHEALSSEETTDFPEGHISRVFKKPFKLHDRLVRPAQVVVARTKSNS